MNDINLLCVITPSYQFDLSFWFVVYSFETR